MNKVTYTISIIFTMLFSSNSILIAQTNPDSLQIIKEAMQMIQFPDPVFSEPFVSNPSPKEIADLGFEQSYTSEAIYFKMRDGINIHGNLFNHSSETTVLFIHGALGSSYTNNKASGLIRKSLNARVIALDLRGHGLSKGIPGDVTTTNQYVEDLQDIIKAILKQQPRQRIILAGHSMGGGIVLRYAETTGSSAIDGYILFAPNLGAGAPTSSKDFDIQNNFIKIHLSRGLGLSLLNELGIHKFDSLKIVFYNLPREIPLKSYSHRSIIAGKPMDYVRAFKQIDKPLLVLVGEADEAFEVEAFQPIVEYYSKGELHIVKNETHNGIRHSLESMKKLKDWAIEHNLRQPK